MNGLGNLTSIFFNPEKVATSVAEKPRWLPAFVIFLVVMALVGYGSYNYAIDTQYGVAAKVGEGGKSQEVYMAFLKSPAIRIISSIVQGISMFVTFVLIPAALLNSIASIVGTPVGFKRMLAYMSHVGLIIAAGQIVRFLLIMAKHTPDVRLSPAAFFPNLALFSPMMTFLSSFDIFSIWALIAVVVGYKELAKMKMSKAVLVVVSLWLIGVGILVGLVVLRGLFVRKV